MSGKPKKIALIDPSIFTPPYDQALADGLIDIGLDVHWLGRKPRDDDAVSAEGVQPIPYFYRASESLRKLIPESYALPVKAVEHFVQTFHLCQYLASACFDIAHFQWTPIPYWDKLVFRRIKRVMPVILTVHDTLAFHGNATHSFQQNGWGQVLRMADRLIVHVPSAADAMIDHGVQSDRIHVIPHPAFPTPSKVSIEAACLLNDRQKLGFATDRFNFLLFGRLAPYKGIETIFEAIRSMRRHEQAKIRVVLAGKSAFDHESLKQRIVDHGLDDTIKIRPTFIEDQRLVAYLALADSILFPYSDIDASGAFMQAIAYSPAIIASDIGVFSEMLEDGKTAVLIRPEDSDQLRSAMLRMSGGTDLVTELRENIKHIVQTDLSWTSAASATHTVYDQALRELRKEA